MKQKVISNTKMFIEIILFINVFNLFFGKENTLVGVSIIVLTLILLAENLTNEKLKNFIVLSIISLGLGISSHIASNNIWIGFFINFIILSLIGYFLSYKFTKNLIVAFGLQYMFMLYTPVYGLAWGKRIIALIFGGVCVMIAQIITYGKINKKKPEEEQKISDANKTEVNSSTETETDIEVNSNTEVDEKVINLFGKNIKIHPVRFAYAVRVGLLTAITAFISGYFDLKQGRWMTFTVFSLTEIYSEYCKVKSKERIQGTIIGILIVIVSFTITKNPIIRTIIGLAGGYFNSYTKSYRGQVVCVTVSVVAAMSVTEGTIQFSLERLMYVIIGAIISLIANKLIFYSSENNIEENQEAIAK